MHQINRAHAGKQHQRRAPITTLIALAAAAVVALMGVAATPMVALAAPKGIFAKFAQCPTSVPGVALCQYVEVTSGELAIGALQVPIDKTVVFQGGMLPTGALNVYFVLPAVNGESISPTEQDIPGGLHSIIGCEGVKDRYDRYRKWRSACRGFSHDRGHDDNERVTATLESAASPTNPAILDLGAVIFEEGTGLTFPGKIHLKNPLLGEECYIGSEAHPIQLHFTDSKTSPPPPNQPITGKLGELLVTEEQGYELETVTNNTLVDNAVSVPPAEGCGRGGHSAVIDSRIDQTLGLESPAGHNTAILTGTHRLASAEAVLASEKFPTKEENPPPPPRHHRHHHHQWWWPTH